MSIAVVDGCRPHLRPARLNRPRGPPPGDPALREHDLHFRTHPQAPPSLRRRRAPIDPHPPLVRPDRARRARRQGHHRGRRPARRRPLVDLGRRRARPPAPSRLGDHRPRRRRHRPRRAQDRQGGRRPPPRARGTRHRPARAAWPPSATAAPSTACSTAMRATSRAAGCGVPARCARWPPARRSAVSCSSGQWANAEFGALTRLWQAGVPVPYPVQLVGTELLLEYLGTDDGQAAPRLAQLRPDPDELADLWAQLVDALLGLARLGPGPRRPVGVQPARPRRAAGRDRPAAGGRRRRQPERAGVPRP